MTGWRMGRGIADVTGEPWGVGMMGYGMPDQRTNGVLSRQFARAFVLEAGSERVAFVVADIGMFFQAGVDAIHEQLTNRFGDRYGPGNVVLSATHTHCGPGGHGHDLLYNITTAGFHGRTFERLVNGAVEAIVRADADLAPTTLLLNRGELTDASANRARAAFERDPADEKALFPDAIDPATTLLRFEREGDAGAQLVGAINWFAVHNTSMSNRNCLISADNKGWAAWQWEQDGADPQGAEPGLVTAFAQTNAGDLSPNLALRPADGPDEERANTRIIGDRQLAAARQLATAPGEAVEPVIETRHRYLRLADLAGPRGSTGRAILGASFAAGKLTDGPGSPLFDEGKRNPVPQWLTERFYRRMPGLAAAHAPKDIFLPVGRLGWIQETYLLQLMRWGGLVLVCVPFEVSVVSGLRMRRAVAAELGVDVDDVLIQGYANGYGHYVTMPEEYDEQLYEGGATVFGRHELDALCVVLTDIARSLRTGAPLDPGTPPAPRRWRFPSPAGSPRLGRSRPVALLSAPKVGRVGQTLTATFATGHPNATRRASYLLVERSEGEGWEPVATDAHPTTSITWRRDLRLRFEADVTWAPDAPGTYRITCLLDGRATTPPIVVR